MIIQAAHFPSLLVEKRHKCCTICCTIPCFQVPLSRKYTILMATVKLTLRTQKTNKEGKAPIYLRITKRRNSQFISLGIYVEPRHWDPDKQRLKPSATNSSRTNALLAQKVAEAEGKTVELERENKYVRAGSIKEHLMGKDIPEFFEYACEYIEREYLRKGQISTYKRYKSTIEKLNQYCEGKKLYMDHMTVSFLKKYEDHLRHSLNNVTNTITKDLKSFRRIINSAIEDDLFPFDKNPFLRFKLSTEKAEKTYLTESELKAFASVPVDAGSKREVHQDMFVFACYAGGIRISDLLQLRWSNLVDGTHLSFQTQKTNTTIPVKVPDKGLAIIKKYRKPDSRPQDFIFPLFDAKKDYSDPVELLKAISSATAYANKDIAYLTDAAGIEKKVSFHTSRHTFATLGLRKGIRIEYVSKLMGHASVKTTEVYAKIVNAELDKAMDVFND